jgi:hypothetical protein
MTWFETANFGRICVSIVKHYINILFKVWRKWPQLRDQNGNSSEDPNVKDWYTLYKQQLLIEQKISLLVLDLGSHSIKWGFSKDKSFPTMDSLESVVAAVCRIFCLVF